ncbi:MAG: ABC transporter substrate-binding protein [Paludibacter sp.]|nr:ABC transporter substrate-binding protein [Paludibacter sp.]
MSLFIMTLYSCKNKREDTIKIGVLDGPSAVSFIQLIDKQTYVDSKRIEIIVKSDPLQIQALMMREEIDFSILPTIMAANLYNKGLKYKVAACPIWGTLYLLTNEKGIDINHLSNHKISVFGQASTSDILLRRYLNQKYIKSCSIDYTHTTNHELAQALKMKTINLAVVSEPLVSILIAQDPSINIVAKINCEDYINSLNKDIFVQTSFLISNKFIANYPALAPKVCELYSKSCNFVNEQPEATAKLLVKHNFSPNIQIAKASLPLCNIQYVAAFAIQQELTKYLNIFYQFNPKSIGGKIPDKDFIFQTY